MGEALTRGLFGGCIWPVIRLIVFGWAATIVAGFRGAPAMCNELNQKVNGNYYYYNDVFRAAVSKRCGIVSNSFLCNGSHVNCSGITVRTQTSR